MENLAPLLLPLLIVLMVGLFFQQTRRQRKVVQELQAVQAALEPGDVVMTTSGLRATVVDATYEDTIDLEIADGVVTTWARAAVREKVDLTPDAVEAAASDDDAATFESPSSSN